MPSMRLVTGFSAVVLGASLSLFPTISYSQESVRDRLADAEARIEELERAVAELEERVAALEGDPTAPEESNQNGPSAESAVVAPGESSREQPVPMGTSARVGDWSISVVSATPDAEAAVLEENMFNAPPERGHQFFMVTVSLTYEGSESAQPGSELSFKAVGDSNVAYDTFSPGCGVVPHSLSQAGEVFEEGTVEANVCFPVKREDADSLVMYVEPLFSLDDARTWFAWRESSTIANG